MGWIFACRCAQGTTATACCCTTWSWLWVTPLWGTGSWQWLGILGYNVVLLLLPPPCSALPSLHVLCLTARAALLVLWDLHGPPGLPMMCLGYAVLLPWQPRAPPQSCCLRRGLPPRAGCYRPAAAHPARLCGTLLGWAGCKQAREAMLSPHPCCQHSMGLTAKQVTAHAPLGTCIGLLSPQTAGKASILPPRDPATCQALGCSMGPCPVPGSAHIFPQGKRRAGARLSKLGLDCITPRLWPHPASMLSLGTFIKPCGGHDQRVPSCP